MHVWKTVKVFVSSTFKDLELERDRLAIVFNEIQSEMFERRLGLILYDLRWRQRHDREELVRWCLEMVNQCGYFIGILGRRYGWRPPMDAEGSPNEKRLSITEMEISQAVATIPKANRFFCLEDLSQCSPEKLADENEEDLASLKNLKENLIASGEKVYHYQSGEQVLKIIAEHFRQILNRNYPPGQKVPLEKFTRGQALREIIEEKTRLFVGREKYLQVLRDFLQGSENYLAVYAVAGTGKSSLLAQFIVECEKKWPSMAMAVHYMAVGRQTRDLWQTLAEQLSASGILAKEQKNAEILQDQIRDALENTQKKVLLVIDGLDEMDEEGKNLEWLPSGLSDKVKIILSTRPVNPWPLVQKIPKLASLELPPLERKEILEVIEHYHREHGLKIDWKDRELLLKRASGNPLFLKVAMDEILSTGMAVGQMATSISQLFEQILNRVESKYGQEVIETCLGLIAAGRAGVTEKELRDILKSVHNHDDDVLLAVSKSLENFIIYRKGLLDFFHPEFERSIKMRLGKKKMRNYCRYLADYLRSKGYGYERTLSELAYIELCAKRNEYVLEILTDFDFLLAKCEAGMANDLALDWQNALHHQELRLPADLCLEFEGITVNRETLRLLEKVFSLDLQFIRRNPSKLFQCLWNRCYWHDAPEAATYYQGTLESKIKVSPLVEKWRKNLSGHIWLRSLKPLDQPLDSPLLKILRGETDWVKSVKFSPDGRYFVSASRDRSARIWNALTGERIGRLRGHAGTVQCAVFSRDGERIITSSSDKTVRIWEMKTAKCLKIFEHEAGVECADIFPDGTRIASGGWENLLYIWDLATGQPVQKLEGHQDGIEGLSISIDGSCIASASRDKSIRLWDTESGACLQVFQGHTGSVNAVKISPDKTCLVSCSSDKTIRLWDLTSGECRHVFQGHKNGVFALAFSPDGSKIVSGSSDRTLRIWSVDTGECLNILTGHIERVFGVDYSPDGMKIVSGGGFRDKTIRLWAADQSTRRRLLQPHGENVKLVTFAAGGQKLVTGSDDGTIAVWNLMHIASPTILLDHKSKINKIVCNERIFTASQDHTVRVWDLETGECLQVLKGHTGSVESLVVTGNFLVSCSKDKTIRIWDLCSQQCVHIFEGHKDWVSCLDYDAQRKCIVSGSRDNTARIWNEQTGECLQVLEGHEKWVCDVVFHPENGSILTCSRDHTMRLWNTEGKCLRIYEGHGGGIAYASFSSDGNTFVSCSWDLTMRTWDTKSGKCLDIKKGWGDAEHMVDQQVKWTVVNVSGQNIIEQKNKPQIVGIFPAMINQPAMSPHGILVGGSGAGYIYLVKLEHAIN